MRRALGRTLLSKYISLENNEIFVNYLDANSNNVNPLKSYMEVLGLSQLIKQPSRYSALNPPTLIDHLYTNSTTISNSGTFSLSISDHATQRVDLCKIIIQHQPTGRSRIILKLIKHLKVDPIQIMIKFNSRQNYYITTGINFIISST